MHSILTGAPLRRSALFIALGCAISVGAFAAAPGNAPQALAQVRDLSNLLRPSVLDDLGLVAALRAMRCQKYSPSLSSPSKATAWDKLAL